MELVYEWFPTGKFRKFDTPFLREYAYKNYLMDATPLTGDELYKEEMEFHGK